LRSYIDNYLTVIDEAEALRVSFGLKSLAKKGEEGWFYVPRQTKEIRGIELKRPSNPALQRHYEDALEGFQHGVRYDIDPRATLELHLRRAYQEIIDKQLSDALEPLSIVPKGLIPDPVRIRMEQAVKARMAAEREVRRLTVPRVEKGLGGKITEEEMALRAKLAPQRAAAQAKLAEVRSEYQAARNAYTKAMASARKAEVAPGRLFGLPEEQTIAIANWRNRFFPREMQEQLEKGIGQFGKPIEANWAAEMLGTTANTIRFLASVGDFATPFIQGLPVLARDPAAWARATARHYQAFLDPVVQSRLIKEHLATYQKLAQHGVPIGDPEFFAALKPGQGPSLGKLLEILPKGDEIRGLVQLGGRQTFGRFQASYNTFLGQSRVNLWESMAPTWKGTEEELAQFLRNTTGGLDSRALGVAPNQRNIEGMWLAFSPRLLRSTVSLSADALRGMLPGATVVQQESLRTMAQLLAGATGIYITTGLALGKSWDEITEGLNPLSGRKFMSHQIGDSWVGIGGQVRSLTQLMGGLVSSMVPNGKPATDILAADPYDNPIVSWYLSRGAPAYNIVGGSIEALSKGDINALAYEDLVGVGDLFKHIGTSALPFTLQGRLEGEEALASIISMLGLRASRLSPFQEAQKSLGIPLTKDLTEAEVAAIKATDIYQQKGIPALTGTAEEAQEIKEKYMAYQAADDELLEAWWGGDDEVLDPRTWRDNRKTRMVEMNAQRDLLYANIETQEARTAADRYYQKFDEIKEAHNGIMTDEAWDELDIWVSEQSKADRQYIEENTRLSSYTPLVDQYFKDLDTIAAYWDVPSTERAAWRAEHGDIEVLLLKWGFLTTAKSEEGQAWLDQRTGVTPEPTPQPGTVEALDLSARAITVLKDAGLNVLEDFAGKTRKEILDLPDVGEVSVAKIEAALQDAGLAFKPTPKITPTPKPTPVPTPTPMPEEAWLNINTGSLSDWESLPYIGPALAQRIIDYIAANGEFTSIDDLVKVSGIGKSNLDKIRKYLKL